MEIYRICFFHLPVGEYHLSDQYNNAMPPLVHTPVAVTNPVYKQRIGHTQPSQILQTL